MQAYLFVHFREKTTPDGEQVYFGVSKDGFNWEEVNGGDSIIIHGMRSVITEVKALQYGSQMIW